MKDFISLIWAQMADPQVAGLITSVGWPGLVVWIMTRHMDRMESTLKGLSKALWYDLATRDSSNDAIKAEAKKELQRMAPKDEREE